MGGTQPTVVGELYAGDVFAALVVMFGPWSDGPAQYEVQLEHRGRFFFFATAKQLWELTSAIRDSERAAERADTVRWAQEVAAKIGSPGAVAALDRKGPAREWTRGKFTVSFELLPDARKLSHLYYDVMICYSGKELLRCSNREAQRLSDLCRKARKLVANHLEQGGTLDDWQRENSPAARAARVVEHMRARERPVSGERRPPRRYLRMPYARRQHER